MFHGAETASDPFRPGRSISGFRTGPLGLGHVVMHTRTPTRCSPFYRDLLGFRLTDYYSHPFEASFLHVNPRHHSLAFIQTGKNAVHHMMMELYCFDDIGQGYDIAQGEDRVATTLAATPTISSRRSTPGRRPASWSSTAGARADRLATWQAYERKEGPSMWGHDRTWLPRRAARGAHAAAEECRKGMRRPVQVMEGNYQLMSGVCPWWDQMKAQKTG